MIYAMFFTIIFLVATKISTEKALRERIKFLEEQLEKERNKR